MMFAPTAAVALVGLTLFCAGPALADVDEAAKPVKLPAATQAKLGLRVQPLAAATRSDRLSGYLRVLDAGPLAQLDSDLQAAEAAAAASSAEAARSKTLNAADQAVSTKALQAAQAQARADSAKLSLLRRRVGLEWGSGLARMSGRERSGLIAEIAAGRAALVRLDTGSGRGLAGVRTLELDLGPAGKTRAVLLGPARTADVRLLSAGVIARISGAAAGALASGLSLPVTLSASSPLKGVIAPRSALLRSGGKTWVYIRTAPEQFIREAVEDGRADPAGLFVTAGLRPGQAVVTTGAAVLFAAETNATEAGGD